jgi:hypothetical protein
MMASPLALNPGSAIATATSPATRVGQGYSFKDLSDVDREIRSSRTGSSECPDEANARHFDAAWATRTMRHPTKTLIGMKPSAWKMPNIAVPCSAPRTTPTGPSRISIFIRFGQADGFDLDLDALVRARCDLRAGSGSLDRVHVAMRPQRYLVATLLVDVSLSTDAWVDGQRVLDVEKEALLVLAHGLSACGAYHSILTFTSRRRSWVRVETVKSFEEPMGIAVERRIGALKPGYYTRIGAAVRHAAAQAAQEAAAGTDRRKAQRRRSL